MYLLPVPTRLKLNSILSMTTMKTIASWRGDLPCDNSAFRGVVSCPNDFLSRWRMLGDCCYRRASKQRRHLYEFTHRKLALLPNTRDRLPDIHVVKISWRQNLSALVGGTSTGSWLDKLCRALEDACRTASGESAGSSAHEQGNMSRGCNNSTNSAPPTSTLSLTGVCNFFDLLKCSCWKPFRQKNAV